MIRTKDVLNCLPLLASILGDRYGVQVRIGGKEACTNGKVIFLPSLPMDCEPELLLLAKGFCDHEAAHIRHTDFSVLKAANLDPVIFNLCNCLEDWRVEKKLSGISQAAEKPELADTTILCRTSTAKGRGRFPGPCCFGLCAVDGGGPGCGRGDPGTPKRGEHQEHHFPGLKETLDAILVKSTSIALDTKTAIEYAKQIALCIRQWEPPHHTATKTAQTQTIKLPERQPTWETNDSTSQIDQQPESTCASAPVQQSRALNALPLKALFHAEAQDLPQNIGEIMAIELTNCSVESTCDSLTVAVEGTRQTGPLLAAQKLQALQASIALRMRLQGFLQA
jgi:hypothetical protein